MYKLQRSEGFQIDVCAYYAQEVRFLVLSVKGAVLSAASI